MQWPQAPEYSPQWRRRLGDKQPRLWLLWYQGKILLPSEGDGPLWQLGSDQMPPLADALVLGKSQQQWLLQWELLEDRQLAELGITEPQLVDLRSAMMANPSWYPLLSRARQLFHWHKEHRYCGGCGQPMAMGDDEAYFACEACDLRHYPRIAPCILVLITRGDYCLLARGSQYAEGFYSALAGFIESGESAEQALKREVYEEVGLAVKNIRYRGSQPWPFPSQLMLGYHAEYAGGDIRVDGKEIIEAKWWHRDALPEHPGPFSLSGQLIQHFVDRVNN